MSDLIPLERPSNQTQQSSDEEPVLLCSRCVDLDINKLWISTSPKVALGNVTDWDLESCVFCRFLGNILSPLLGTSDQRQTETGVAPGHISRQSYFLYSMRTNPVTMPLLRKLERRVLVLSNAEHRQPPNSVPYIAIHPTKPPFWLKQIQPLIDFSQPKKWLGICTELHAGHCRGGQDNVIANLRLIDCSSEEVVEAKENDSYVAISYVWGHDSSSKQNSSRYPQTIQDAITVTRELGYTRLWVDKYCLDQKNQLEFDKQLQQMDTIYQQAVVTLIAAAGQNAEYGLPGVSKRLRAPNPSVRVGQQYLSPIRGVPDLYSDGCKWTKRAWTYQEGLISTRRLVFTDDQLYFECQGFYCLEMLEIPLDRWKEMHHRNEPYLHSSYRVAPHMGAFPLDSCGVDPWDIYIRIKEYSNRSLTFETDILKGMLGIFRVFERGKNPIRHLYGIPFPEMALLSPNKLMSESGSKRVLPTFSDSLRWNLAVPSKRRKGFPSWSWTGWLGTINWPSEYIGEQTRNRTARRMQRPQDPKANETAIKVSVELRDGAKISWEEFQKRYHEVLIHDKLSGIIHLEAYMTPAVYSHCSGNSSINLCLRRVGMQSITLMANKTIEYKFTPQDKLLAIQFHRTVVRDQPDATGTRIQHVLIVQDRETHWERVAYGTYEFGPTMKLERAWRCLRLG
ncbi:heterokaryon incompatibility protein-domain-containing protein [Phaeosphaeriaceae sp. PMI808]|nr:heterokaryon incompatibility protein-domain-containing protein [Phaeosphaeriaceae sp. PMI808]